MKRQSFIMLLLKGIGYIIFGNVLCLFMTMGLTMFGGNIFTNVLAMLCGTAIFYMLIFTAAWKDGVRERKLVNSGTVPSQLKYRWIFIGLAMFAAAAAPTVVLLLNKLLFPQYDLLIYYRLISGSALPFVVTFIPVSSDQTYAWVETAVNQVDNMPVLFPILMLVFYLLIPVCTHIAYNMGYNDRLNPDKVMYK